MIIKQEIQYKVIDNQNKTALMSIKIEISKNINKQMYCVHRSLKNHLTNNRIRRANTKTRSEVRGGGKKPWKQKGTGRARAGSTRSPLWRGGGVIFGPKYKIYQSKINKKEKRLAINTLLYNKSKNTIAINETSISTNIPNTKNVISNLRKLGINTQDYKKILIVLENKTRGTYMSLRNIQNIELIKRSHLNTLSLLKADLILISTQAIDQLNTH